MRGSRGKIVMKTNPKPGSPPFPHSNRIFTLINFEFTNNQKIGFNSPLKTKHFLKIIPLTKIIWIHACLTLAWYFKM